MPAGLLSCRTCLMPIQAECVSPLANPANCTPHPRTHLPALLLCLPADNGLTRPGAFLFELLGRCGISSDTWSVLYDCLDRAVGVLTEEAVDAGRRWVLRAALCPGSSVKPLERARWRYCCCNRCRSFL